VAVNAARQSLSGSVIETARFEELRKALASAVAAYRAGDDETTSVHVERIRELNPTLELAFLLGALMAPAAGGDAVEDVLVVLEVLRSIDHGGGSPPLLFRLGEGPR
jgi:hypothetical protein